MTRRPLRPEPMHRGVAPCARAAMLVALAGALALAGCATAPPTTEAPPPEKIRPSLQPEGLTPALAATAVEAGSRKTKKKIPKTKTTALTPHRWIAHSTAASAVTSKPRLAGRRRAGGSRPLCAAEEPSLDPGSLPASISNTLGSRVGVGTGVSLAHSAKAHFEAAAFTGT